MKSKAPYTPKPIRGQSIKGYTKVSQAQVKKLFADGQSFNGFIVGNKVAAFHFFGGWHLACTLSSQSFEDFTKSLNSFHFYLEPELGSQAAIYLKKRKRVVGVIPPSVPLLIGV